MTNLIKIAKETLNILEEQKYTNKSGRTISLDKLLVPSIRQSVLYKPQDTFDNSSVIKNTSPKISVTNESTLQAATRLKDNNVCALNFASAKHAGGGFTWGSKAQEESIARASGLYYSLIKHPEYYEENKASQKDNIGLYLDYAIYSPKVPVFRDDECEFLDEPYTVSIVTSPAPNWTNILEELEENCADDDLFATEYSKVCVTLYRRILQILNIMAKHNHRTIILGAWGCGVFGNEPYIVSKYFSNALKETPYFDDVIFAVYDKKECLTYRAFELEFSI